MSTEYNNSGSMGVDQGKPESGQSPENISTRLERVVILEDWKRRSRNTESAGISTTRLDDHQPTVSSTKTKEAKGFTGVIDPHKRVACNGTHHGQSPDIRSLARQFLDELLRRACQDNYKHLEPLRDFCARNKETITAGRRFFFEEMILILKSRLRFTPCPRFISDDPHIADFSLDMKGVRLRFIALECDIAVHIISPALRTIFLDIKKMDSRSDTELICYITSFSDVDRPWLLFAALYIVAERGLEVRLSRYAS